MFLVNNSVVYYYSVYGFLYVFLYWLRNALYQIPPREPPIEKRGGGSFFDILVPPPQKTHVFYLDITSSKN